MLCRKKRRQFIVTEGATFGKKHFENPFFRKNPFLKIIFRQNEITFIDTMVRVGIYSFYCLSKPVTSQVLLPQNYKQMIKG